MDLTRLTSAIVRQTTVLIARLSTLGGTRSPLAHVADEVFLGLVGELERQGVGKKVAADMFGLALRSYQLKVQRLQESASESGVTLWAAIRGFVEMRGTTTRAEVLSRFGHDDPASVRGILNDLVESGLAYRTGRGEASLYRATPREDLARLAEADPARGEAELVWLVVARQGPLSEQAIALATNLSEEATRRSLTELLQSGRLERRQGEAEAEFDAARCLIPIGDEAGWEASVIDHHQAVLNAIAAKIESGVRNSGLADRTGGSTYSFELWPGHPHESRVLGLLASTRADVAATWEQVTQHNADAKAAERDTYRVTFYIGQSVRPREDMES